MQRFALDCVDDGLLFLEKVDGLPNSFRVSYVNQSLLNLSLFSREEIEGKFVPIDKLPFFTVEMNQKLS